MKILIVSTNLSHPTDAGNRSAIMGQVQILEHLGCEIHFLFADMSLRPIDDSAMKEYWGNHYHTFHMNMLRKIQRLLIDKLRIKYCNGYWKCDDHYPWGIDQYINNLNTELQFDAVIVQYIRLSRVLPKISISRKAIYTHDVFSYKDVRVKAPFYETCNAHEEAIALQRCPNIFAIQEEEAIYYKYLSPQSKIYTVYNPYIFHKLPIVENKNILFLASQMDFNVYGIIWFLENVWQSIVSSHPEAKLLIGGSVCKRISKDKYPNIELCGYIDSLKDFYSRGNIVINPVDQGTGLKIKTFESLSFGKTTLVNPHSTIGVFQKDKVPVFCAQTSQEWILQLSRILQEGYQFDKDRQAAESYINDMYQYISHQYSTFLGLNSK